MSNRSNTKAGATAIELLIYTLILSLILGVFFTVMTSLFSTFANIRATRAAIAAAQTGFERVVREARSAASIDDVGSVFGMATSTLALVQRGGETIVFSVQGSTLMAKVGSGAAEPLTPQGIVVQEFRVTLIDSGRSRGVTLQLSMADERGTVGTYDVRTSVVVRGSYE